MATLNEIVYDLRNMTRGGLLSDDEIMSHDQFKFWVHNTRAMLVRRDIDKRRSISDNIKQVLSCIDVEQVDASLCCNLKTDCKILRTSVRIPRAIQTAHKDLIVDVRNILITSPSFHFIPYHRAAWAGNNRYTQNLSFSFLLDGFIYVMGPDNALLEKITVTGVFANPSDAAEFVSCSGDPCYSDDQEYPISADIIEVMKGMIIQNDIQLPFQAPVDTQGNAKHDLRPNQSA